MLVLTPTPLQTAGERALFGELTRWDTGGSVRAAVVASLPTIDGVLGRRISDAVLFVPEGIAVIRVVEVLRQNGVVTARPEGAWTIAPESGPSQALQLSGGGSTPLDGLMRAGLDAAMKLRRAGLEPGRIARLTVLVGDVTGLIPADGDLGEGDQVALLEPRSLLLGIARASRYASVDNPRLWTTADVRAALEALGLEGRGPTVEELNGEAFPYSPYVLRRPELLTPAALAAGPALPGVSAPAPAPVREQPSPAAIAQAVAASAAAAHAAAAAEAPADQTLAASAPAAPPAARMQPRDTVAIDAPAAPDEDAGIGGLFARADSAAASPASPRTSVFPAQQPSVAPSPAPQQPAGRFSYWTESVPGTGTDDDADEPGSGRRIALVSLLALVVVGALAVVGWLVLGDRGGNGGDGGGAPAGGTSAAEPTAAGPQPGDVQEAGGVQFTVQAVQVDDTCIGHAYGDTQSFLEADDCTGLSRALYSAELEGGPIVVSVSRVQMPDNAIARELQALTDTNGSGNVSDLLREGVRYTGSPSKLSGAEYASAVSGSVVTIVETAWVENPDGSSAEIDQAATYGLELATPPFPGQ
ncbi:hypothetical protein [Blastococcus sp. PRF04-17]|uniref:hypothetical protein n=1 Tax=Blastococcus sp. PRF04-17 TaxID=2933797 RepID=UPI001FF6595B|nr:hypothetical protein [Blastococcus sp. PRF04-17]UOY03441.1 hypothetical protein MVA48_08970 [Blastococcus sp. PRF04-17]